jgi:hypothetical protein
VTRIVTTAYRPKRQPKKRKAVAIAGPAVVRKRAVAPVEPDDQYNDHRSTAPTGVPANDDRKPAIVTTTSRKRVKLLRPELPDDPEADARVKAFLARMIRPGGTLPPAKT